MLWYSVKKVLIHHLYVYNTTSHIDYCRNQKLVCGKQGEEASKCSGYSQICLQVSC